ncbi:MAG TPA: hypothetical protein VKE42_04450 [Candidatus Cybelea sp.]|nr:hypothetical protein [Candidatus Cybelea sp.]
MQPRDLLADRQVAGAVYGLPWAVIIVSGFFSMPALVRAVIWALCFSVMGAACAVNALRCGRIHCYFTGPFFFLMALLALFYGLGIVRLGGSGWNVIGVAAIAGTLVLYYLPELFFGRYRRSP